jgi:hypothetical protein
MDDGEKARNGPQKRPALPLKAAQALSSDEPDSTTYAPYGWLQLSHSWEYNREYCSPRRRVVCARAEKSCILPLCPVRGRLTSGDWPGMAG